MSQLGCHSCRICARLFGDRPAMLFVAAAMLGIASFAGAQQSAPARDSANQADTTRHGQLPSVVISGTRLSDATPRMPSRVEPLDLHTLPIAGPEEISDELLELPGVSMFDDQGARLQPEIEVRGFTSSSVVGTPQGIGVFLNGIRVNEPDAQEVDYDLLPSAAIDRASLDRGSNVLFGRNSLGGTLLMTTKRGDDIPEATGQLGVGSWGDQVATLTAGGKSMGVDAFIAGTGENEVGWKGVSSSNTRNVFGTIGYQWGPTHDSGDVALDVLYGHDKIFQVGSLPVAYAGINPRYDFGPGDDFSPEALDLDLRGNTVAGGGLVRATLFARRNVITQFNSILPPPDIDNNTNNQSGGTTIEWTRPLRIGSVPIGFTVGTEYSRESSAIRVLNVLAGPPVVTTQATIHQDNAAAYSQAVVSITRRLDITGGIRYDYVHIPYRDHLDAANDGNSSYNRLSPEIGLTDRFTDVLSGYVAYKSGFRAPAPLELACADPTAPCSLPSALGSDPALKPVTTEDYEGGLDLQVNHRADLQADVFWTDVFNDIVFASPNRVQTYFLNAPQTRRAGVETSANVGLPQGTYLTASYSYVAATFQSVVAIESANPNEQPTKPGDIMPSSPLSRGRVGVGVIRPVKSFLVNAEFAIHGFSSQYLRGDEANQLPQIPGYAIAEIRGHVDYKQYGAQFEIENVFNRQYDTFGVLAQNNLIPIYSQLPLGDADSPVVPFVTTGFPRRVVLTLSVRY
jgi:iron complex outermembrane recepter protein